MGSASATVEQSSNVLANATTIRRPIGRGQMQNRPGARPGIAVVPSFSTDGDAVEESAIVSAQSGRRIRRCRLPTVCNAPRTYLYVLTCVWIVLSSVNRRAKVRALPPCTPAARAMACATMPGCCMRHPKAAGCVAAGRGRGGLRASTRIGADRSGISGHSPTAEARVLRLVRS